MHLLVTDFTSTKAKLARAQQHLDTFESVLGSYVQSKPVSLIARPNTDGTSEDFLVSLATPLPTELDVVFGDCIHNLRSTLDHLAMALAVANGASPDDTSVSFPIFDDPARFHGNTRPGSRPGRGTGAYAIRTLIPAAQAFIESVQPYNRQSESFTLTEVQYLYNRDKHRFLIEHQFEVTAFFAHTDPRITIEYVPQPIVEDGAFYATVKYAPSYQGQRVIPPLVAVIGVERSNRHGFLDAQDFLHRHAVPYIQGIVNEAERRFP